MIKGKQGLVLVFFLYFACETQIFSLPHKEVHCPSYSPAHLDEGGGKRQLRDGKGWDGIGSAVTRWAGLQSCRF